jgi:hypothetical protein
MKIILLLLLTINIQAQLFSKNNLASYGLLMVSGAASGVSDALVSYRPFRGDSNWDMYVSWTNKYKNNDPNQGEKFPLSTSVLVGFTDGWHAMNMVRDLSAAGAVAISFDDLKNVKTKWKYILGKMAIGYTFNRVGHTLMYSVILK